MNNPLKRQSSNDNVTDSQYNNKRQKALYNDLLSPNLKPVTDIHSLLASHLPPSPPILVDTPSPLPTTSLACTPSPSIPTADSIPTLKRFTITTRHQQQQQQEQQQQQQQEYTHSDYANINEILHEAHFQRHSDSSAPRDSDMMDCEDHSNYYDYDYANSILRQAFLQRHSSPPS